MIKEHAFGSSDDADKFIVAGDRIQRCEMVIEVDCSSRFFPKVRWVVIETIPEDGPDELVKDASWARITPDVYENLIERQ